VSSVSLNLEAAVVAGTPPTEEDLDVLRDLSNPGLAVWSLDAQGEVLEASRL
jgi:hypothetical protein